MKPRIPIRISLFALAVAALAACSDTTQPTVDLGGGNTAGGADSGSTNPGTPGGGPDTALTHPDNPTPVDHVTLHVTVARPVGGADTLSTHDPVAGAEVSVLKQQLVPGPGPDTLTVQETLVASGTTDASGQITFSDLPGSAYRVVAKSPDGSSTSSSATGTPWTSEVAVLVLLR